MSSWNVTLDTVPLGVCALLFATGQNLFILMACPLLLLFLHSSSFVTDFSCHGTECSLWCIYDEEEASSSLKNLRDVLLTFQRFSTALILMYTYYQQQVRQNSIKIHHFLLLLLSSSTLPVISWLLFIFEMGARTKTDSRLIVGWRAPRISSSSAG